MDVNFIPNDWFSKLVVILVSGAIFVTCIEMISLVFNFNKYIKICTKLKDPEGKIYEEV